jgi:hypothetical protein
MDQTAANYNALRQELLLPAYQGKTDGQATTILNAKVITGQFVDFTLADLQLTLARRNAYPHYQVEANAVTPKSEASKRGSISITALAASGMTIIPAHDPAVQATWVSAVTLAAPALPPEAMQVTQELKDLALGKWSRAYQLFGYGETVASGDVSRARAGYTPAAED